MNEAERVDLVVVVAAVAGDCCHGHRQELNPRILGKKFKTLFTITDRPIMVLPLNYDYCAKHKILAHFVPRGRSTVLLVNFYVVRLLNPS